MSKEQLERIDQLAEKILREHFTPEAETSGMNREALIAHLQIWAEMVAINQEEYYAYERMIEEIREYTQEEAKKK